jgi:hypothetical protein
MEWLKALLEKATITDGKLDIDALMKAVKEEFPKNAVPKSDFNTLNDTKKDLEQQIRDRDKQLKDLGEKVKGNEEAEKTIKDLQEANKKSKDEYDAKIKDMKIDAAIKDKLGDVKDEDVRNYLASKFDKAKIVVGEDGSISGIDEQYTGIKEKNKNLIPPTVKGNDPYNKEKNPNGIKNPWSKEHFNLTEQGKLLKENPELARQFMASK